MSLIKCPECGIKISDKAKSCPHCGFARRDSLKEVGKRRKKVGKKKRNPSVLKVLGIGIAFIIVLSILKGIFTDSESIDFKYVHTAVNLRNGPGTNHEVIVTLSPGSRVEVIEKGGEWWKVRTSEVDSGYVYQSLLKAVPEKQVAPKNFLKYSIHKEDVYDEPIKTQVALDVLIIDKEMDEQKIKDLLNHLYDKTIKRSGFKHHDHPTNIYIYAYTSKDKAESGMGQWVGMISKSYNDKKPKIAISDTQLSALIEVAEDRWGLTHEQRKEVWNKIILAQDKAQKEADEKYPTDKLGITQDDIIKNIDFMRELEEEYENEITNEYGVDKAIIDSIGLEGSKKGWAFPKQRTQE